MPYQPIVGTLGFILSPDHKQVLMVHRTSNQNDDHLGKYNGLGGKMEKDEDVATCMIREIKEESGLDVLELKLRGTINWTGFGKHGEDWLGFIFLITKFKGTPWDHSPEGPLKWIPINDLHTLPMWEGDRYFLPLLFDEDERLFHGYMPYENHKALSWSYSRV